MSHHPYHPTVRRSLIATVEILLTLALGFGSAGLAADLSDSRPHSPKPTIVLVHGTRADASDWNEVADNLRHQGYPVIAPANPLRSLASTRPISPASSQPSAVRSSLSGAPTAERSSATPLRGTPTSRLSSSLLRLFRTRVSPWAGSWYMVARNDHTVPADTERFMAQRAGAHTVEVRSSHVAMISHADAVTRLILSTAHAS